MAETKTAEQLAAETKAAFDASLNEVKGIAEEALGKAKAGEALASGVKEKADEALLKMNGLKTALDELEQKLARDGDDTRSQVKSIGEQLVEGDGFKAFAEAGFAKSVGRADVRIKATLTSSTTDAAGSIGAAIPTTRLPGILEIPQRKLTIRDLISSGRMDGNALEYVIEKGFNNNAAPVAEGAAKPSSDIQLDLVTTTARVIAHWMKAPKQALSDFSQLQSLIDQHLIFGLRFKEEAQILNGDGTGQNLHGIIPQATAYAPPAGADAAETTLDVLRIAMLQAVLAEYPATGHVLHPIDWSNIERLKDTAGWYLIANPQGSIQPTLWGLPVVETHAIATGKFLTGAFKLGAQLFDRWDARIEVGYENDDFTKNLVTILAEERLALAVYRPEAFVYGDIAV
ncbi:phage major capsid protein [Paenirhodobacter populi]|uniref:Phage major capsid protein n=1 Tax=Paenirhodobacter populi TaxID=2306993 RepID=A0A443JE28_9RHOB|nr:phage major capsid protein [Sinirhodobacter populi]RWR18805.1 phage major capsid protein [Sinirhodobacter populi]